MIDKVLKVRETRLRHAAFRQGLRLERSRARDERALTYGKYQLIDLETGRVVFGRGNLGRGYAATIDEIEKWLNRTLEEVHQPRRAEPGVAKAQGDQS